MRKIYNEITIDMNPESSSYKEVLFEDSFLYNGPMMLMENGDDEGGGSSYGNTEWLQNWFANNNIMPSQYHQDYSGIQTEEALSAYQGSYNDGLDGAVRWGDLDRNPTNWSSSDQANDDSWIKEDETPWQTDPTTGIKARRWTVKTADWWEGYQVSGYLWEIEFASGSKRWKPFSYGDGYQSGAQSIAAHSAPLARGWYEFPIVRRALI